jgi:hypothetical protein
VLEKSKSVKVCILVDVGEEIASLWLWLTNLCEVLVARNVV